jgi:ribosomal protein L37AE/L43A
MALRTESAAHGRLISFEKNYCPQCSAWLIAPDGSEHLDDRRARHSWSCDECGCKFATTVFFSALNAKHRTARVRQVR